MTVICNSLVVCVIATDSGTITTMQGVGFSFLKPSSFYDGTVQTKAILLHHDLVLHRVTDINVGPKWQCRHRMA